MPTRRLRALAFFALASIALFLPAASEYRCDEGKPNKTTKKCDCPKGLVEVTDAKDVSRCVKSAEPKPSSAPPPKPPPQPTTTAPPLPLPTAAPTVTSGPPPPPPVLSNPGGKCPAGMAFLPGGTYTLAVAKTLAVVGDTCLDGTEVTVANFETCVATGACAEPLAFSKMHSHDQFCNWKKPGRAHHAINCVDWNGATAYCASRGKRLPTEAEWEWAARGGIKGTTYPWGDDPPGPRACWNGEGSTGDKWHASTCRVGSFPSGANPQGVLDLAGSVWEWTSSTLDPSSTERVYRGGDWNESKAAWLTAGHRDSRNPISRVSTIGFRCARTP